ncbi:MAG: hypothetical protein HOP09_14615 [Hyphomicrobium sp.]|nr:hypothetical protein [Hyphomicrobium sp.]
MPNTVSVGWNDVRSSMRQGIVGDWARSSQFRDEASGVNASPQTVQSGTITVTAATNSKVYTETINGIDVSYTSDASATTTEIAAGLAAAINAEPLVRGYVSAVAAVAVVTVTALWPGIAFTMSDVDAELTTVEAVTAAASANAVPFGRAVISKGRVSGATDQLVALADASHFTAQVVTVTPSGYVAGAVMEATIVEVRGTERIPVATGKFTSATDLVTSLAGLVTDLNLQLPANSVLASNSATVLTLTSEVSGLEFAVEMRNSAGGSPTYTVAYTNGPSASTSLHRALLGFSRYSATEEATSSNATEASYPANGGVIYATKGSLFVAAAEAPTEGETVYVEMAAGANAGKCYVASGATRVALSRARASWGQDGLYSSDGIAALNLT